MPIDNKIHLQVTAKKNPTTYQYGDLIYNRDGTLKTINEGLVPVELAKKADLTTEIATIENKLTKKADLDENGLVPASQLPSYVDDVLEFENKNNFPEIGEAHKVYVDITTNMTYRWSGSGYVIVGNDLALGETTSTAYAGDKGKANADTIAAILDGTQIVGNANLLDGLDSTKYLTKDEYNKLDKDEVVISETQPTSSIAKIWYPIVEEEEEDYQLSEVANKKWVYEQLGKQGYGDMMASLYDTDGNGQVDIADKVANALVIRDGDKIYTYDGSQAIEITIIGSGSGSGNGSEDGGNIGDAVVIPSQNIFVGTQEEFDALTPEEQEAIEVFICTNEDGEVVDFVTKEYLEHRLENLEVKNVGTNTFVGTVEQLEALDEETQQAIKLFVNIDEDYTNEETFVTIGMLKSIIGSGGITGGSEDTTFIGTREELEALTEEEQEAIEVFYCTDANYTNDETFTTKEYVDNTFTTKEYVDNLVETSQEQTINKIAAKSFPFTITEDMWVFDDTTELYKATITQSGVTVAHEAIVYFDIPSLKLADDIVNFTNTDTDSVFVYSENIIADTLTGEVHTKVVVEW